MKNGEETGRGLFLNTISESLGSLRVLTTIAAPSDERSKSSIGRFTYLLTPWSRVFPKKLRGLQLLKKFPTFY
jgi:hypothetical protein